jgi:periplasmic protein TonB
MLMARFDGIPGFDDLIFENRNRDYGAYFLRKRYNSVLSAGIVIAIVAGSLAVILPFVIKPPEGKPLAGTGSYITMQMENLEPPPEQIIVPPAPPPREEEKQREIIKYIPPLVVDTLPDISETPPTNDEVLAQTGEEPDESQFGGFGDDLIEGEGGMGDDEPFFLVEVMPTFRGKGLDEFRKWVIQRTAYPKEAYERRIQGRVYLTFVVESDGSVSNVTIQKGIDPMVDEAATKAIESSPRWSPGLQRGKPVRVRYSLALLFLI